MNAFDAHRVPAMLREYATLVRPALDRYLVPGEPRSYLYDLVREYPMRGGKLMRPSLCIATARSFGAPTEAVLLSAVAIELMHNATLIHDDIEDESEERRGKPTLHALHGVALALNAGDMLNFISMRPLVDNVDTLGLRLSSQIVDETQRMTAETAEGQALELGWIRDNVTEIHEADYLDMVLKKTCWLSTIFPIRVGALIATGGGIDLDPFVRFGFFLGAAYQIRDDVLNIVAERARYGKELEGDLWEGKRTLILIHLWHEATPEERLRLEGILHLRRTERTSEDVSWMRRRIESYGSIDYAQKIACGLAGAARNEFELLFGGLPPSRDKAFLEDFITWVIARGG